MIQVDSCTDSDTAVLHHVTPLDVVQQIGIFEQNTIKLSQ